MRTREEIEDDIRRQEDELAHILANPGSGEPDMARGVLESLHEELASLRPESSALTRKDALLREAAQSFALIGAAIRYPDFDAAAASARCLDLASRILKELGDE